MRVKNKILANHIRNIRKSSGLTIDQVLEKLKISKSYLMDFETGRSTPSLKGLIKIMDALNVESESTRQILILCLFSAREKVEIPMNMLSTKGLSEIVQIIQKEEKNAIKSNS